VFPASNSDAVWRNANDGELIRAKPLMKFCQRSFCNFEVLDNATREKNQHFSRPACSLLEPSVFADLRIAIRRRRAVVNAQVGSRQAVKAAGRRRVLRIRTFAFVGVAGFAQQHDHGCRADEYDQQYRRHQPDHQRYNNDRSNLAKAASNIEDFCLIEYFLGSLGSLHCKQDLDTFSGFCRAQTRHAERQTNTMPRDHRSQ